jgi:teichuronic acid exporter
MNSIQLKNQTITAIFWSFIEKFSTQIVSFIVQILLVRLLFPSDYGLFSITSIFILIGQVFISVSFSSSIIQKKSLSELESSSLFYMGIIFALIIVIILFLFAPIISYLFNEELLILIIRVQSISILLTSLTTIQNGLLARDLLFKRIFKYRFLAVLFQGFIGFFLALNQYGVWSIVLSSLAYSFTITIVLWFLIKWRPSFIFSFKVGYPLFFYGFKIFLISLTNNLLNDFKSLFIGFQFGSESLGFYNRGYQIPMLLMVNTDGAINSVMFSSFSKSKNNQDLVSMYRRTFKTSIFIVFPSMIGLFVISEPLIILLFSERWINSIPFIQIMSLVAITWPFSLLFQLLNSNNKEKKSFFINFASKLLTIFFMLFLLPLGIYFFLIGSLIGQISTTIWIMFILKKDYNYGFYLQIKDIAPTSLISVIIGFIVYFSGFLTSTLILKVFIQVITGIVSYLTLSLWFNNEVILYFNNFFKNRLKKNK